MLLASSIAVELVSSTPLLTNGPQVNAQLTATYSLIGEVLPANKPIHDHGLYFWSPVGSRRTVGEAPE